LIKKTKEKKRNGRREGKERLTRFVKEGRGQNRTGSGCDAFFCYAPMAKFPK
jgi:hypothetical protein